MYISICSTTVHAQLHIVLHRIWLERYKGSTIDLSIYYRKQLDSNWGFNNVDDILCHRHGDVDHHNFFLDAVLFISSFYTHNFGIFHDQIYTDKHINLMFSTCFFIKISFIWFQHVFHVCYFDSIQTITILCVFSLSSNNATKMHLREDIYWIVCLFLFLLFFND